MIKNVGKGVLGIIITLTVLSLVMLIVFGSIVLSTSFSLIITFVAVIFTFLIVILALIAALGYSIKESIQDFRNNN